MKTPWDFFARLTGRRRQRGTEEKAAPSDLPSQLLLPTPAAAETSHSNEEEDPPVVRATDASDQSAAGDVNEAAAGASFDEVDRTLLIEEETVVPSPTPGTFPRLGPAPARESRSLLRTKRKVSQAAVRLEASNPSRGAEGLAVVQKPLDPERSFLTEVRELDEEVKQLRLQLAQKLRLQNQQLRKMLERFDHG